MPRYVHYIFEYRQEIADLALSFLSLTLGGAIYIGFRSTDLVLYRFLNKLGLKQALIDFRIICSSIDLPEWVRYSLPDGLWLAAYLLVMNLIWRNHHSYLYYYLIYLMPALAILTEIGQYIGYCPGTFDSVDLICYIIPLIILIPLKHEV